MAREVAGGEVVRAEVAGVPAFWPAEPDATRSAFRASLLFRVGMADETLPTHGITHLVEHLALHKVDDGRRAINGSVGPTRTQLFCEGTPDEVRAFLREVTGALGALPFDRLDTERRVLRTEADGAAPTIDDRLLNHRYGPRSFGLPLWGEMALEWVGRTELEAWVARWFTRGNAVLCCTSEPPEGIELVLPDGPRRPRQDPVPIPELQCPCYVSDGTGGVVVGSAAPWSPAMTGALVIARERLRERLRRDEGLSYGVTSDAVQLTPAFGHAVLGADCTDEHAQQVLDVLLRTIEDLAADGATDEELAEQAERAERALVDADPAGDAMSAAEDELFGEDERWSRAAVLEAVTSLDAATVGGAMRAFAESAIVIAPDGVPRPEGRMVDWQSWEHPPVSGDAFPRAKAAPPGEPDGDLVVGAEGLTQCFPGGDAVTIRFDRVAAALRRPFGALTLIADDDRGITVDPVGRRDGEAAVQAVLDRLPDELVVPGRDLATGERVRELAEEQLGALQDRVVAAIRGLPGMLGLEEHVELLGFTPDGEAPGLVVATEGRLLHLLEDEDGSWMELPWHECDGADLTTGLRRGRLRVRGGGTEVVLKVEPKGRAEALLAYVQERCAAVSAAPGEDAGDADDGRRLF